METYEAIVTRRSTRKFKDDPIPEETLQRILEAGRHAPSGGNSQTTRFIVIRNRGVLDGLADLAREEFAKMEAGPDTYRSLAASINASKRGTGYVFHYHAPVLVVTANKVGYGNALADCSCAIENMMLEANELGLGSCWINQLHWLADNPRVRARMLELGMADDETVCASVALGYADTADGAPNREPQNITGNPVAFVD